MRAYEPVWRAMQAFTRSRTRATPDEVWRVEHPAVYTLGIAGREVHLPRFDNGIPVVRSDRGGQITYHGPGQLVLYLLLDLNRRGIPIRGLVRLLESAVIDLLVRHGVRADRRESAPGVYVGGAKIAALGLRVQHGCCYHGLALNVAMDLTPFDAIDPCGYPGLGVTDLRALGVALSMTQAADDLAGVLLERLDGDAHG